MDARLASMLMETLFVCMASQFHSREEINPAVWGKTFPPLVASVSSLYQNTFGCWMLICAIQRRMR